MAQNTEQKELEKNGKKTKVVALTNEYIMSLENYLNNPNTEIRLMAAKEILTRLDEDKDRYDDVALNALLNKMLQDPEQLIRVAAMSAFSSKVVPFSSTSVKTPASFMDTTSVSRSFSISRTASTVGPSPLGYCSVTIHGTSIREQALANNRTLPRQAAFSFITFISFC